MRGRAVLAALFLAVAAAAPAGAIEPQEQLADPALEARARTISQELRCLVCQNESIDDSNADLARDLRRIVRERLTAGDTDDQVVGFVTARYGDYVLLRPPLRAGTLVLWFGPVVLLFAAIAFLILRRRRRPAEAAPLSAEESRRLARLMDEEQAP
ncbi:cytochrome c-type biogenesis protein [Inquilinus sp. Marseille-Q2685]|uniref:cytochrome c-type biogenesis protein n=1 Tax=Inquilinus sp. Marseille-Q2685 TaxID=2866581 RepID=UPI001CE3D104|nr:cytochrome c-type biogenesis protein [Inquilinus sp. Marseille-Q2685]